MKKLFSWLFGSLLFSSIFLVPSGNALFYAKEDVNNLYGAEAFGKKEPLSMAANDSDQSDTYAKAEALFKEKKYDDVIKLLAGLAYAEPNNPKPNILLAKAQVEKCAILKAKGDQSYKTLIYQPYKTARRLHKLDKTNPELYYIVAKSLLINQRVYKSVKTAKKALYFAPNNPDYLVLLADGYVALAESEQSPQRANDLLSLAKDAYEKAVVFRKDDEGFKTDIEKKIKELSGKKKSERGTTLEK
jgi:hypothetical protein